MTVEKTVCDCCAKVKGERNGWHQIGVQKYAVGIWIELGVIGCHSAPEDVDSGYEVHDLCSDECLREHLMKLLRSKPMPAEVTE